MLNIKCHLCNKDYKVYPSTIKWNKIRKRKYNFCSKKCSSEFYSGINSNFYKTGRNIAPSGYVRIAKKDEPAGFRYEHRLIMEKILGRRLKKDEQIHHINGNKSDNRLENLMIVSSAEHNKIHEREISGEKNPMAKLNKEQVKEIRKKYEQGGYTLLQLGNEYGICFQAISTIVRRKSWKDI